MSERIYFLDTTLRDGAQTYGVDFTLQDKQAIFALLDDFGLDYIEAGWPGANPTDTAFFNQLPNTKHAQTVAFGMTARAGTAPADDTSLQALLATKAPVLCLVGKSWDYQVRDALGITLEDNLELIRQTIAYVVAQGREVIFDAEHFFDGFKANADYACQCAKVAFDAGARWVTLCDTNGGTMPHEITQAIEVLKNHVPAERLGIHTHDDCGLAVANSLAAVQAGVRLVQGTLNGLGERCGNANLITLIPNLHFKMGYNVGVAAEKMSQLKYVANYLDERLNRDTAAGAPYVGQRAFAHKGGLHVAALSKATDMYEHITPETVGNERLIIVSDQAGRRNILSQLQNLGIDLPANDPRVLELLDLVKQRDAQGYAYDMALGSFEILARQYLGLVPTFFNVLRYSAKVERRYNQAGELVCEAEVSIKLHVQGQDVHTVAEGNGPVNAMDKAMRKALLPFYPQLNGLVLSDYKVRILQAESASAAVPRVLIESHGVDNKPYYTTGVSTNIIDASCEALQDSYLYYLLKNA